MLYIIFLTDVCIIFHYISLTNSSPDGPLDYCQFFEYYNYYLYSYIFFVSHFYKDFYRINC